MEKTTLKVNGMTCMGCVNSVKRVVSPIAGVHGVDVSLEKGEVTVEYDRAPAPIDAIKSAIEDAGYDVVS